MKITVENTKMPIAYFKDLKAGEVFVFKYDVEDNEERIAEHIAIKTDEDSYVYLDNGLIEIYCELDEEVLRVEVELIVKGVKA